MTTGNKPTILITESRPEIAEFLEVALSCHGYAAELFRSGADSLAYLQRCNGDISAVLVDAQLPGESGLETVRELRRKRTELPVVVYSQENSPDVELEARSCGASDFLKLPVSHADLARVIARLLLGAEGGGTPKAFGATSGPGMGSFLCLNPMMQAIRGSLRRLALSDVSVVFHGESGVGKEVLARALHLQSPRSGRPFLKLNCAAVPSELLESELFGYERGAFTGAFKSTAGKFEQAEGGTILLDEIGDMEPKLQAKLLHVLQDREFQRLGGREVVRVNVRVLAATHRHLEAEILEGRFRSDLYYRLNVICVDIPPLRERTDEILPFVELFLRKHSVSRANPNELPPAFKQALLNYDWPGNIRELENVVQRYLVLQNPELIAQDLSASMRRRKSCVTASPATTGARKVGIEISSELPVFQQVNDTKAQLEAEVIRAALELTHWNRKKAAEALMMDYKALLYKMKKLDISAQTQSKAAGGSAA